MFGWVFGISIYNIVLLLRWRLNGKHQMLVTLGLSDAKFECISNPTTDDNNCLYVNKGRWKFTNPIRKTNKGYCHWRLKGVSGTVKSSSYINILFMKVS